MTRWAVMACVMVLSGCGYHVGAKADMMPKSIHTIAIPAFSNATTRAQLADRIPEAIAREFISRTRYQIVSDQSQADAVLRGGVNTMNTYGIMVDPTTGRASTIAISLVMQVSLIERATGKVLFTRPSFELKQEYQVTSDERAYFDESDVAMTRLARDAGRSIVSAILENF